MRHPVVSASLAVCFIAIAANAQRGRIVTDTVRSASLANLLAAPAEARVSVYLPPSYDASPRTHYPVLYLLHGYGSSDAEWTNVTPGRGIKGRDIRGLMDSLVAAGATKEMIIVMPNASNRLGGSFYLNSTTTGNWDDFMAHDVVTHIDHTYRTLSNAESRGVAGVSMGGFGTFSLAMRHGGDTYGAMYAVSACCTSPLTDLVNDRALWTSIAALPSYDALATAPPLVRVMAAGSAAGAPNAAKPPLFFDLVAEQRGGKWVVNDAVVAKWNTHSPLLLVASSRARLIRMRGIRFDIGAQDEAVPPHDLMAMDSAFTRAAIPHSFEVFQGTHDNRITERLATTLIPFFSHTLVFETAKE
jgi:S-formylglutathione hydrolase